MGFVLLNYASRAIATAAVAINTIKMAFRDFLIAHYTNVHRYTFKVSQFDQYTLYMFVESKCSIYIFNESVLQAYISLTDKI